MSGLLMVTCLLASGKIAGQETFGVEFVRAHVLILAPPAPREYPRFLAPPRPPPQLNPAEPRTDRFRVNNGSEGNLPPPVTLTENQPRQQEVVNHRTLERMDANRPLVSDADDVTKNPKPTAGSTTARSEDRDIDVNYDDKNTGDRRSKPPIPPAFTVHTTSTTEKTGNGSALNTTGILGPKSFDSRTSFGGDQCPNGYIKVNGSNNCVKPD